MNRAEAALLVAAGGVLFLFAQWNAGDTSTGAACDEKAEPPRHAAEAADEPLVAEKPAAPPTIDPEPVVWAKLNVPLKGLSYFHVPLQDVFRDLSDRVGVDFLWDRGAPEIGDFDLETPIDLPLEKADVTPRMLIRLILEQLRLDDKVDFIIRGEIVYFTSLDRAVMIRVYDCEDMAQEMARKRPDLDSEFFSLATALKQVIFDVVEPRSWVADKRDATITVVGNALIVRQTAKVHGEIEELLARFRNNLSLLPVTIR